MDIMNYIALTQLKNVKILLFIRMLILKMRICLFFTYGIYQS